MNRIISFTRALIGYAIALHLRALDGHCAKVGKAAETAQRRESLAKQAADAARAQRIEANVLAKQVNAAVAAERAKYK